MFFPSATLVVLTVVGCCTYSVDAANTVTLLPNENTCVSLPPNQNVTYNCSIDEGNVVWQLNEYQLIDRDQFQNMGVMVQEVQSGDFSTIQFLLPDGVSFLINNFGTSSFTLECVAVTDEVKVDGRESRTIAAYNPSEVPNLQASSNNGVTTVTWDPVDLPVLVTYTITITDLDNSVMLFENTTQDTQLEVPADITCDRCEISVTARGGDCTSLPTTITIPIPTCSPIETKISCTECDKTAIGITFELSSPQSSDLPENTTVTLRNDTGVVNSRLVPESNVVSFDELDYSDIYHAEMSVDTMECVLSNTILSTRALNCSVTYYKSCGCLKCSFTPGTEDFPWGVQFAFNVNEKRRTVDLSRSEAFIGNVPEQSVAGSDVEAYMWLREGVVDTQSIPTDVILADSEDEFPCKTEDCDDDDDDDDDDICGTICIIIVIVVGVLCLILGTLLGALLGYCLYKSYSCKDGKKRVSTELSETTGKLFDEKPK